LISLCRSGKNINKYIFILGIQERSIKKISKNKNAKNAANTALFYFPAPKHSTVNQKTGKITYLLQIAMQVTGILETF